MWVYIIKSCKTGKFYIGHTSDLPRRIADHNRGKSRSVRNRGPFDLVYKEEFLDRAAAVRREKEIKRYKGGNAFKKLISQNSNSIVELG